MRRFGGPFGKPAPAGVFVMLLCLSSASLAADPDKARCADAYESTQRLERAGKLIEALEAATTCANPGCPELLRVDCVAWLSPLKARQSSLVIEARDAHARELFEVKVSVDGAVVQERLDGRAFFVDPGEHALVFESSGGPRQARDVVVREGEQGRRIVVTFGDPRASPSSTRPLSSPPMSPGDARVVPVASWVLGGLGVAALGAFGAFGISGKSLEGTLDRACAPHCDDARVADVRARYIVADVSLAVGVVSLGVATWLALSHSAR